MKSGLLRLAALGAILLAGGSVAAQPQFTDPEQMRRCYDNQERLDELAGQQLEMESKNPALNWSADETERARMQMRQLSAMAATPNQTGRYDAYMPFTETYRNYVQQGPSVCRAPVTENDLTFCAGNLAGAIGRGIDAARNVTPEYDRIRQEREGRGNLSRTLRCPAIDLVSSSDQRPAPPPRPEGSTVLDGLSEPDRLARCINNRVALVALYQRRAAYAPEMWSEDELARARDDLSALRRIITYSGAPAADRIRDLSAIAAHYPMIECSVGLPIQSRQDGTYNLPYLDGCVKLYADQLGTRIQDAVNSPGRAQRVQQQHDYENNLAALRCSENAPPATLAALPPALSRPTPSTAPAPAPAAAPAGPLSATVLGDWTDGDFTIGFQQQPQGLEARGNSRRENSQTSWDACRPNSSGGLQCDARGEINENGAYVRWNGYVVMGMEGDVLQGRNYITSANAVGQGGAYQGRHGNGQVIPFAVRRRVVASGAFPVGGNFDSSRGAMTLSGSTGTYDFQGGRLQVTSANGNVIAGTWTQTGGASGPCADGVIRGRFEFTFNATGFTGKYAYCEGVPNAGWNGTKRP